jgi:DNA-3-methyladenine glycosylase II
VRTGTRAPQRAERGFELRPRPPFRLDLTAWALRRRAQNAIDTWDGRYYRRALVIDGAPFELAVAQVEGGRAPVLEVILSGQRVGPAAEAAACSMLTRLLGLDVDLSGFYARAARDSVLGALTDDYRGVKPPRFPTIFECLVNAVACQQLSISAGLTVLSRLAAGAGASVHTLHAFPEPSDVLGLSQPVLRSFGFSDRKAETILDLAEAAEAGELEREELERWDDAAVVESLVRRRGIGNWSADYVLLRGLGRLHVFPRGDSGALNGLRRFLVGTELEDDPESALDRWAPDAGLVYFHLLLRGLEQRGGAAGSSLAQTAAARSHLM